MPAIFGAFGNFLLPTQLGVHDVAFPRLNSAAFWFLPGGLIMLCQLVCVDRRYQRMNCFNIRELQGILKRKFFTDLVNTTDSHKTTDSTLISMRHKNNMSNILTYDQSLLYNFDLTTTSKSKTFSFTPGKIYTYSSYVNLIPNNSTHFSLYNPLKTLNLFNIYIVLSSFLKDCINLINVPTLPSLTSLPNSFKFIINSINSNFLFSNLNLPIGLNTNLINTSLLNSENYNSSPTNFKPFNISMPLSFSENSSS
jgi:hypothetical protein